MLVNVIRRITYVLLFKGQAFGGALACETVTHSACLYVRNSVVAAGASGLAQGGAVLSYALWDSGSTFALNTAVSTYTGSVAAFNPDTIDGLTNLPLAGGIAIVRRFL